MDATLPPPTAGPHAGGSPPEGLAPLASRLADALRELDAAPLSGAVRLRTAVLANRLAQAGGDPFHADVAEAVAEEDAPGATRSLREALREQADLARALRRRVTGAADGGPTSHAAAETDLSASLGA